MLAKRASDSTQGAFRVVACKSAFPNPQDCPARLAKFTRNRTVALGIPGEFAFPKRDTSFRRPSVARTAVPKAAIHKHSDLLPAENEIGLAR